MNSRYTLEQGGHEVAGTDDWPSMAMYIVHYSQDGPVTIRDKQTGRSHFFGQMRSGLDAIDAFAVMQAAMREAGWEW